MDLHTKSCKKYIKHNKKNIIKKKCSSSRKRSSSKKRSFKNIINKKYKTIKKYKGGNIINNDDNDPLLCGLALLELKFSAVSWNNDRSNDSSTLTLYK